MDSSHHFLTSSLDINRIQGLGNMVRSPFSFFEVFIVLLPVSKILWLCLSLHIEAHTITFTFMFPAMSGIGAQHHRFTSMHAN